MREAWQGELVDEEESYHVDFKPTLAEGTCDRCSGEVVQRNDDVPDTVRARLATYHEQTAPVLGFFEDMDLVEHVDATGTIESVTQRLRLAIG